MLASSSVPKSWIEQLVDIFSGLKLEKHPLKKTRPTIPADIRDRASGFSQAPLFETPGKNLGPFAKLETAYKTMIPQRQMNAIGTKDITCLLIDNYLALCWRLSAPSFLTSPESDEGAFYLKYKGDYILMHD